MAKRKVVDLKGSALDWSVAKALAVYIKKDAYGWLYAEIDGGLMGAFPKYGVSATHMKSYEPSMNWAQGGPLIENYGITLNWLEDRLVEAYLNNGSAPQVSRSCLVAAMRALVASKLGDEVEIPEEIWRE